MQSTKGSRPSSKTKPPDSMMTSLLDKVVKDKSMALLHSPDVIAWLQEEQRKRTDHTRMNTKRRSSAVGEDVNNQDFLTTQDLSPVIIRPDFSSPETEHAGDEHYCDPGTVVEQDANDIQANSCLSKWTHEQRNQNRGELSVPSKDGSAFKKFSSD